MRERDGRRGAREVGEQRVGLEARRYPSGRIQVARAADGTWVACARTTRPSAGMPMSCEGIAPVQVGTRTVVACAVSSAQVTVAMQRRPALWASHPRQPAGTGAMAS